MAPAGRGKRGRGAPSSDATNAAAAGPRAVTTAAAMDDDAPPSGLTALHRWRSAPWEVSTVTALAACPDGSAVAAAYENGRVEVWHLSYLCRLMAVPGWDGADLSSLAWAFDSYTHHWRLFAGSLDGAIYEVDFTRQQLLHASDSYGGAVWALVAQPRTHQKGASDPRASLGSGIASKGHDLAAACDDGSVRVLRVVPGAPGCEYVRSLAKVEGKTLSLAWHPEGRALVSGGSDGCIHVWDFATGRELMRITAAVHSTSPPCIWSLAVLPDGTIVSGDSDGATQFWEGRFGTLISRLQQHAADVMAVAASADGAFVYSAGVDPRVAVFKRVQDAATGSDRWAYLAHKSPHTHDVRALASAPRGADADELLLSGGVDGQLVVYPAHRILQEHPIRLTKAPQGPIIQLSPLAPGGTPRLMLAQGKRVTLWRLGRAAPRAAGAALPSDAANAHGPDQEQEGEYLDLSEAPACIAELRLKGSRHVAAATAAADGSCVAVSDASGLRLFRVEGAGSGAGDVEIRRVEAKIGHQQGVRGAAIGAGTAAAPPPAVCMAFAADGGSVFCADAGACVRRVDAQTGLVVDSLQLDVAGLQPLATARAASAAAAAGSISDTDSDDSDSENGERAAPAGRRRRRGTAAGAAGGPRTAAGAARPSVSHLVASPDGRWLAAASSTGVTLIELRASPGDAEASPGDGDMSPGEKMAIAGPLLLLGDADAPVTAVDFSPDSSVLAVSNAADGLAAYSVATRAPTQWSADHWDPLSKLLAHLPGTIEGLSFDPAAAAAPDEVAGTAASQQGKGSSGSRGVSLLVRSAGGFCHVDMAALLSADVLSAKRRRGPFKPRPGSQASAIGLNGRVLPLDSPVLFVGYIGERSALLVERQWEEVVAGLPMPLCRHRYGT